MTPDPKGPAMTDQSGGHTPGRWSIITGDDGPIEISIDGSDADSGQVVSQWVIVESETHAGFLAAVIDMNYPNSYDDDQLDANARLIAAAPDLVAVAKQALEFAVLTLAFHGRDGGTDRQERMLDDLEKLACDLDGAARAAITLATGAAS